MEAKEDSRPEQSESLRHYQSELKASIRVIHSVAYAVYGLVGIYTYCCSHRTWDNEPVVPQVLFYG